MSEPQSSDQALVVLRALIEEHSSVHHVARCLGMDHTNLGRVLAGEYRLHHELVEKILDVLGLPVSIFLRLCLPGYRLEVGEATALLKFCRPKPGRGRMLKERPRRAFLLQVEDRLSAWLEVAGGFEGSSRRAELFLLEDERFVDPASANDRLEVVINEFLDAEPTVEAQGDLAMAIAIWSALRRIEGSREEAREGCLAAMTCLPGSEPISCGFVFEKAAYIAMDFDQLDSSLLLLNGALAEFLVAGELEWQARIFADRGIVLAVQGRLTEAEADLKLSLDLLPMTSARYRFACQETLAEVYQRLGRLAEAELVLKQATLHTSLPLAGAFLAWRRGALLCSRGLLASAEAQLQLALSDMKIHGEALDAALIAVDLAGVLLRLGHQAALRELFVNAVKWMGRLADNKAAHTALVKLIGFFYSGELNAEKLAQLRAVLDKADRRKRPATKVWS